MKWNLRAVRQFVLPVLALLLVVAVGSAAARTSSKPLVLHPHWRVVVGSQLVKAVAKGRYVAILQGYSGGGELTLIDEHTGRQQVLSPPNCSRLNSPADQLLFGGPWLLVECGDSGTPDYSYLLYNLNSQQWSPFTVSPQCQGSCQPIALGRYWVKIVTDEGIVQYGPNDYYLQNITTGEFERDPATPGATVFDDPSAPSGSRPLCAPLRYPVDYPPHGGTDPGLLSFYGQFAVAWDYYGEIPSSGYHLRRCHSRLNLMIHPTAAFPDQGVLASSRAVIVTPDGKTLLGWFLPSLRRFSIIRPPRATQVPCPSGAAPVLGGSSTQLHPEANQVIPVALSDRRLYVRALCGDRLWATVLTSVRKPR